MSLGGDLSNVDLYAKLLDAIQSEAKKTKIDITLEIQKENEKILQKLNEQNKKIANLEKKCTELQLKNLNFERQSRKNNLIIFGLEIDQKTNLLDSVLKKLKDLLDVDIFDNDINNIYQLKNGKICPIKVEFVSYLKKLSILKKVSKLKGSGISIAQDLCKEDRQEHKILQEYMKLARSKHLHAKIKGYKLQINNDFYTCEELQEINLENYVISATDSTNQTPSGITLDRTEAVNDVSGTTTVDHTFNKLVVANTYEDNEVAALSEGVKLPSSHNSRRKIIDQRTISKLRDPSSDKILTRMRTKHN